MQLDPAVRRFSCTPNQQYLVPFQRNELLQTCQNTIQTHAPLFLGDHVYAPKNINYDFLKPADHYHIFSLRISLLPS
jgi:hypothetical protein